LVALAKPHHTSEPQRPHTPESPAHSRRNYRSVLDTLSGSSQFMCPNAQRTSATVRHQAMDAELIHKDADVWAAERCHRRKIGVRDGQRRFVRNQGTAGSLRLREMYQQARQTLSRIAARENLHALRRVGDAPAERLDHQVDERGVGAYDAPEVVVAARPHFTGPEATRHAAVRLVPMLAEAHLPEQFARRHRAVEMFASVGVQNHDVHAARLQSEHSIREIRGVPDGASGGVPLPTSAVTSREGVVEDRRGEGFARVVGSEVKTLSHGS
jgi:hypothetical protein